MIKPQAAFALPAVLYLFLVNKKNIFDYIKYGALGLSTFLIGFIPFNNRNSFLSFVLERFEVSANQYPYGSVNAFSFWGIFGFWKSDNLTFWIGLVISVLIISILFLITLKKRPKFGQYTILSISLLTTFLFVIIMHERHLLPSLAPLLVTSSINYLNLLPYFVLSFTYVANLSYAYVWITKDFKEIFNITLIRIFILLNMASLLLAIASMFKTITLLPKVFLKRNANLKLAKFGTKDISESLSKRVLIVIMIFTIFTRFYGLSNPKDMYFDEIYHAFTAKLVLHNDPKAWEWWNPHPEGFAYEWTHPPLSKIAMAISMKIVGENQVGWRIPQAIAGSLSVLVVYFLSLSIFKDRKLSLLASFILSLDGLLLVLSRMGMNDTYVLLFTLLSVLLFLKENNFMSSLSLGLAISSKWSAIYTLPILFIAHFAFKKKLNISYIYFFVIPILIYISSYSLMFMTGHNWGQFVEMQKQMWWYHTNLVAEHPYTSPAWSWPLLLRPIYLYDGNVVNGITSRIYAFGNPFVFWFGLFSIIISIVISAKEKFKKLGFIVFAYLVLFLPWIASPRIMFLYHYLPSIPYMTIASAFILRRFNKLTIPVLILFLISFVYFYPHWTAIKIPLWLDESYYWLSSWR